MNDANASTSAHPLRWRKALERRWPLGALAGVLLVTSVVVALYWGRPGLGLPFDDLALDERASRTQGTIVTTEPFPPRDDIVTIRYRFSAPDGSELEGSCTDNASNTRSAGEPCVVEFLFDETHVNRIQGLRRVPYDRWFTAAIGILLLPGLVLLGWWVRGALSARITARAQR